MPASNAAMLLLLPMLLLLSILIGYVIQRATSHEAAEAAAAESELTVQRANAKVPVKFKAQTASNWFRGLHAAFLLSGEYRESPSALPSQLKFLDQMAEAGRTVPQVFIVTSGCNSTLLRHTFGHYLTSFRELDKASDAKSRWASGGQWEKAWVGLQDIIAAEQEAGADCSAMCCIERTAHAPHLQTANGCS